MSRRYRLRQEVNQVIKSHHQGAPKTRHNRQLIMHRVIDDLIKLKMAPPSCQHFKPFMIDQLVDYWHRQSLSHRSIKNLLGAIRTFFKASPWLVIIPTNTELGLQVNNNASHHLLSNADLPAMLDYIEHSWTRSILAFQLFFGLTKTESVRIWLDYACSYTSFLFIDRHLAFNAKDRFIPILNEGQRATLNERATLLGDHQRLIDQINERDLLALYKADLLIQGYDPHYPYRYFYIHKRYKTLQYETGNTVDIVNQLQREVGIASKHRMKGLLS